MPIPPRLDSPHLAQLRSPDARASCCLGPSCTSCTGSRPRCDFTLLGAAQRGNSDAAATLIERHAGVVFTHVANKVPPDICDDVAHNALADALAALTSFRNNGPFRSWLRTVARRAVADHHRRRCAVLPLGAAAEARDDSAAVELQDIEARATLTHMLTRLPRRQRDALWLRSQLEMPYAEIGALLGTTPGGARLLVFRARQRISAERETFLGARATI
jgi:RNA polymerase sigma-70 factor (ECF subfamily)